MLLALGVATVSARAQSTTILSKPEGLTAEKANAFMGDTEHQIRAGDYNAPRQLFNNFTPNLPLPRPLFLGNPDGSVQDALNKRKNWTLQTPEQIMGIQTPEQIMGLPDPKGEGKLSLEEQYLLRQGRATAFTATNGRAMAALLRADANPFDKKKEEQNPFVRNASGQLNDKLPNGSTRYLNQLLNANVSESFSGDDRKQESAWTSVFAQPTQPKPSPDQLADIERFRALMEPSAPPDKTVMPTRFSVPAVPVVDPYLQPQPAFNPAGRSIAALENNVGRPTGIQPLPGIATRPKVAPKTRPTSQAQLPPWLTDGLKPHDPNRNF